MKKIFFESISSTNLYLKENYKTLDDLTVVYANHQTEGRGRLGRIWIDSDDLLFSILLKKNINKPTDYTFIIALAVVNILKKYGINSLIKWPNDIIVNKKKICGILLEGIASSKQEAVIIGVGLNVNTTNFTKELVFKATSMKKELKKDFDKEKLLDDIISEFENIQVSYNKRKFDLFNEIRGRLYLVDTVISFTYNGKEELGTIKGISDEGKLIIASKDSILYLSSGEISFHNNY